MYSEGNKFVLLLFTLSVAPVKASAAALASVKASAAALANAFCWVVVSCLQIYTIFVTPSSKLQCSTLFSKKFNANLSQFSENVSKILRKMQVHISGNFHKSIWRWESYKYLTIGCPKKNFTRTLGVILKQI